MVVCKFFQQGYCRYGQNCRFEHMYGSKYSYQAPSANNGQSVTDEQLVNQVQADVQAALGGGQWIISVYSPFKEKANFPGLIDLSFEEARLLIYEGKANNNLDQTVSYFDSMIRDARSKYERLLNPTPNIIKVLRRLYNGEKPESPFSTASQNMFGAAQNTQNNVATSIFRTAMQTNSSIQITTNNSDSIFKSQASNPGTFFNTVNNNPAKSIFAQASQNIFGPQSSQNTNACNLFATASQKFFPSADPSNKSPFDNLASANSPGSIFQKTEHRSIFGPPSTHANSSVFTQNNIEFEPNFKSASIFEQTNTSNAFGPPPTNIFGQEAANDDSGIYSIEDDLTLEDLEAFKSDEFKLGFIPEIPPPQSLCF